MRGLLLLRANTSAQLLLKSRIISLASAQPLLTKLTMASSLDQLKATGTVSSILCRAPSSILRRLSLRGMGSGKEMSYTSHFLHDIG